MPDSRSTSAIRRADVSLSPLPLAKLLLAMMLPFREFGRNFNACRCRNAARTLRGDSWLSPFPLAMFLPFREFGRQPHAPPRRIVSTRTPLC